MIDNWRPQKIGDKIIHSGNTPRGALGSPAVDMPIRVPAAGLAAAQRRACSP